MTFVLAILFIMVIVFTSVGVCLFASLNDVDSRITLLEIKTNYIEQSEKTTRESVNLQTKCIRDLNNIVKKSVEEKEPTEPDTKALLAGWVVEEPELSTEQSGQTDSFRMQNLINNLCYKNIWYKYPWQQAELNQVIWPYGIREVRTNKLIQD